MANFCIECGTKMESAAKFCTQCGTQASGIGSTAPSSAPCAKPQCTSVPPPLPPLPPVQAKIATPPPAPPTATNKQEDITIQIQALANDLLQVTASGQDLYDLESNSESKWILGKVKMSYEGRIKIDREKKIINFWDMIKKTSSGWGGEDMGFSSEKFVIKGIERSGGGLGFVPTGNTFTYDFGRMRDVVKQMAEAGGWKFKTTLFKPK